MKKLILPLIALSLVACGEDKSVEDYQREKLQEDLAQYQGAEGNYTGVVTSKETGAVIGAMQLSLEARTQPGQNGDPSQGTPVIVTNVRFLDERVISLSTQSTYYDPNTGYYSTAIKIRRTGGSGGGGGGENGENGGGGGGAMPMGDEETITIIGGLNGATLAGTLQDQKYPEYGGSFTLTKNGRSIESLMDDARPGWRNPSDSRAVRNFKGTTEFFNNPLETDPRKNITRNVNIVVLQTKKGTAEDFLDLVNPLKNVQVSLNYGRSLQLLFPAANYDARQGYITGEMSVLYNRILQKMTIECNTSDRVHLVCNHASSGAGPVAVSTVEFTDERNPQPPYENPEDRQSISRTYKGSGVVDGKTRSLRLKVTYPARSRYEELVELFFPTTEKLLQVSLELSEFATPSFSDVKWDRSNGSLDGDNVNNTFNQYIQCHDFYFTKQAGPFNCSYWSSRSQAINATFKP